MQVQELMLAAFQAVVREPLPTVAFRTSQLWGAALPLNSPGVPYVYDNVSRVGICGDWLSGASMQAAAHSGCELARHLKRAHAADREEPEGLPKQDGMGLTAKAQALDATGIGEFPRSAPAQVPAA